MIVGSNLDNNNLKYASTYDYGVGKITLLNLFKTENAASYDILVNSNLKNVEFVVSNPSNSNEVSYVNNIIVYKMKKCNSF